MRVLAIGAAGLMALACAACDGGATSTGTDASAPAADATAASRPATGTSAAETPTLAPAPRGQDGEFGKTPPVGGAAAEPAAPEPQPEPEQPAIDDPAGEEKP